MTVIELPRPRRLWVAAIMNILVAIISVAAVAFLLLSSNPNIPDSVKLGPPAALFALGTAGFLIVSSVLALFRVKFSRWLMLAAALIFFGILALQSLAFLVSSGASLPAGATPKLWANVIRNALEIAINAWALLSAKTSTFFAGSRPNQSSEADGSAAAQL
jgi:amino acid transporter